MVNTLPSDIISSSATLCKFNLRVWGVFWGWSEFPRQLPNLDDLSVQHHSCLYDYITHHHHHHHVLPLARISLTLSCNFSLSFIASGRSSRMHPVSSHSCLMYVWAGRPAFARPYVGVHWNTSLMSSPLLLQQCPEYLVRLTSPSFLCQLEDVLSDFIDRRSKHVV